MLTEILFVGLFIGTAGRAFKNRVKEQTLSKVYVFKEIVQEKIDKEPDIPVAQREDIQLFFSYFSRLLDIELWLCDSSEKVLIGTSSSVNIPDKGRYSKNRTLDENRNITIMHPSRYHFGFYANMPVQLPLSETGTIHVLYNERPDRAHEGFFFTGLLVIGVIIAILVFPLSRIITRRVNRLNDSALQLADGDLSARAGIRGNDEIARLGESFDLMADRLEQLISREKELVANLSHELRSPLARIRISAEIIRSRLDEKARVASLSCLDEIDDDIGILDRRIDDILKISRLDLVVPEKKKTMVDVSQLLQRQTAAFNKMISYRKLGLVLDIQEGLTLPAHPDGLICVISNIVDNAVKFTPENGEIYVHAGMDDEKKLTIIVCNSAPYIDPEELERIFDPFYRIKGSAAGGSGLGLFMAEKIIRQHNGRIHAENTDKGLCIKILFDTGLEAKSRT